jgi:hypothetical protein
MTRSQGFARGDLDTSFPLDDKFLALRGRLTSERYYAGVGVYWTVVAAVWREAERKIAIRVVPDAADLIDELIAVGLLDPDGRVPSRAFTNHIGRARRQRKVSAERQARNRAGKSRGVTRDDAVTARDSAPLRSDGTVGTDGTETGGAGGSDPWDAPEMPALQWLADHGCDIRPGNGYHQKLITAVEVHTAEAMVDMMERIFAAGAKRGDVKGILFGAIDALNAASRPTHLSVVRGEAQERSESNARREVERTKRLLHDTGYHQETPDPGCPTCQAAAS